MKENILPLPRFEPPSAVLSRQLTAWATILSSSECKVEAASHWRSVDSAVVASGCAFLAVALDRFLQFRLSFFRCSSCDFSNPRAKSNDPMRRQSRILRFLVQTRPMQSKFLLDVAQLSILLRLLFHKVPTVSTAARYATGNPWTAKIISGHQCVSKRWRFCRFY